MTLRTRLYEAIKAFSGKATLERNALLQQISDLKDEGLTTMAHASIRRMEIATLKNQLASIERMLTEEMGRAATTEASVAAAQKSPIEILASLEAVFEATRKECFKFEALADEFQRKFETLEGDRTATRVPPILITTMPRSGTYFISKLFADALRIKSIIVSNQYFPHDTIRYHALRELAQGNFVSQDHFAASQINLTHISRYMDRMVCHLRDPRQAMLSWIHHIEQYRDNQETFLFIYPPLPRDFYGRGLGAKIDWAIENWLPLLVEWTEGWVAAADSGGPLTIKFTHYETMIKNTEVFAHELLDFFAIPQSRFVLPKIQLNDKVHFRRGDPDEWQTVFSPFQKKRAADLLPAPLVMRMGWT